MMINIAIAEDQVLFRKGIISLLNAVTDLRVVLECANGEDLLQQLGTCQETIHVALIDINMPVLNGLETMKIMREKHSATRNIILTIHEEEKYIQAMVEAGANAYLAKNADFAEVEKAIRAVVANDYYFNEQTIKAMHQFMNGKKQKVVLGEMDITRREREVLELICQENTSLEISQKLFISESTVNGHRNNLLLKIGCKNTAGLVLFAIRHHIYRLH
ncbi:response regulator [Fluviicola sp.]|uniref:response regulator n=1 Tax=Fluviicola sp. TaxID=1917219 RepID=UPI003D2AD092